MKKYWKDILLGFIGVIVIIPIGVALMMNIELITTETSNEWIGFWGGYLGAIIGVAGAIWVMYRTLAQEKENEKRKEKREFYAQLGVDISEVNAAYKRVQVICSYKNKDEDGTIQIERDKRLFLESCIDLNKALDVCENHLLIAKHTRLYSDIDQLIEKFSKKVNSGEKIIDKLRKGSLTTEEAYEFLFSRAEDEERSVDLNKEVKCFLEKNIDKDLEQDAIKKQ